MTAQDIHAHRILVLDFGSQYTQLIARRIRSLGVFCEIHPFDIEEAVVREFNPRGIILSGGPESVHQLDSPRAPDYIFDLGLPLLGVCYGMQTMAEQLGGKVESAAASEFGSAKVTVTAASALLDGIRDQDAQLDVWMSHGDKVVSLPAGFSSIASTDSCPIAAMADETRNFFAVQFHPEVTHTTQGNLILQRFVEQICGCQALWTSTNIIDDAIASVRAQVGDKQVVVLTPLWWRHYCIAQLASSSPVCLLITDCCA